MLGLSQDALARAMRALGYSWQQTTVAKTEAAERPLRINELTDLAHALGVTITDLLGATPRNELELNAALMQLLRAEDDRERMETRMQALQDELAELADDLKHVSILEREARNRLATLGAVEADGRWGWAEGDDGQR